MTISSIKYKFVLIILFLFMFLGNVLRLVPLPTSIGSFNLFELALYSSSIFTLLFAWKNIRNFPVHFSIVYCFFFISYLLGVLRIQSLDTIAFTYNIRILLFFITSYVIGLSFFKLYKSDLNKILNFYLFIFIANALMAWVIYFIFPETTKLYTFLSLFGIIYNGDPHLHRLLGTVFDPNFFGNLLILPILMSLHLLDATNKKIYIFIFMFLLFSVFFTFSRSALLGLSLSIIFYYILDFRKLLTKFKIKKSLLISSTILIVSILCILFYFPDEVLRIVERFTSIRQDESAAHRYNDLLLAIKLLSQIDILFFGIGFNFFSTLGLTKLSSIDSSILSLMITLGLPIFIITSLTIIYFISSTYSNLLRHETIKTFFIKVYLNYFIVSLILSNFNNLLLYPFWFFSTVPLVCYFRLNYVKRNQ